jgi:hypothetical protein
VPPPPIEELGPRYRHHQPELAAAWTEQVMAAKERQVRQRPQQLRREPLPRVLNLPWPEPDQPQGRERGPAQLPVLDPGRVAPEARQQVQRGRLPLVWLLALRPLAY